MLTPNEIEKEYKERWLRKFQNDIEEKRYKEYEEVKLFNKVIRNKIKLNKKTNIWII